jgi:hypothetical protein
VSEERPIYTIACSRGVKRKTIMPDGVTKASVGDCRGCGEEICWVYDPIKGKSHPYNADGKSHFGTCTHAQDFARKAQRAADEKRSPRLL